MKVYVAFDDKGQRLPLNRMAYDSKGACTAAARRYAKGDWWRAPRNVTFFVTEFELVPTGRVIEPETWSNVDES